MSGYELFAAYFWKAIHRNGPWHTVRAIRWACVDSLWYYVLLEDEEDEEDAMDYLIHPLAEC
jgi:hypothetical protein